MKTGIAAGVGFLLLTGCAAIEIPPEKSAWAERVRREISSASETNYVYVRVEDKQEIKIVERLAVQQGKETQSVKRDDGTAVCVFRFHRAYYLR